MELEKVLRIVALFVSLAALALFIISWTIFDNLNFRWLLPVAIIVGLGVIRFSLQKINTTIK